MENLSKIAATNKPKNNNKNNKKTTQKENKPLQVFKIWAKPSCLHQCADTLSYAWRDAYR